jgi:phospholipid/cholesterol/gamma-HCH transport system permease protein
MSLAPTIASETSTDGVILALTGDWTLRAGAGLEQQAAALMAAADGAPRATLDISAIESLDTAGAWLIDRSRQSMSAAGVEAELTGVRAEHATLLRAAHYRPVDAPPHRHGPSATALLADVGESVYVSGVDLIAGIDLLGRLVAVFARAAIAPQQWRLTALAFHLESFSLRSAPIIVMINFFVGAIVAQQGISQLARYGAGAYTVDLVGILILREMGLLLTSIMVAGRTGSAMTAEIGAMNMREEIDALKVMALDPVEVLILPRAAALVLSMPILTFLGDIAALFGAGLVMWYIGGVTPEAFFTRLQQPYSLERFEVGLIKAPFMALIIGIIAATEGFTVSGSAESLGAKVTSSVVKSIFMVIVVDGIFALYFAAVDF